MNKYRNKKVTCDGYTFDSKREANRYCELRLLLKSGEISDLRLQVPFELIPAQYAPTGEYYTKGDKAGQPKMKCVERAVKYIADFVYTENGRTVVEDAKGLRMKEYIIKRKLLRWLNPGIDFREV